jgi:hypothetical protein
MAEPRCRPWYTFLEAVDQVREWRGIIDRTALDAYMGTMGIEIMGEIHDALLAGEITATERPVNGRRHAIDPLWFCDVELAWLPRPRLLGQETPRLYDVRTSDEAWYHATMTEAFPDLLINGDDLRRKFCPVTLEAAAPELEPVAEGFEGVLAIYRSIAHRANSAPGWDHLANEVSTRLGRGAIPVKLRKQARQALGLSKPRGRPRKNSNI